MRENTFGNPKVYKTLGFITSEIAKLDNSKKEYICSVLFDFNNITKLAAELKNERFKNYTLNLIKRDFLQKIDTHIKPKYPMDLSTHLENFFCAKIRNLVKAKWLE